MTKQTFSFLKQTIYILSKSGEVIEQSSKDFWIPRILEHITEPIDVSLIDCNFNELERFELKPDNKEGKTRIKMAKNTPNKQELAKAERIIHDMEGAIWKLYEIFGYQVCKDIIPKIHQIESLLSDIRRNTLAKFTDTKCRFCGKPVFTPVYADYEKEGQQPLHKRCVYKKQVWR